jgi:hypothetical protein
VIFDMKRVLILLKRSTMKIDNSIKEPKIEKWKLLY